MYQNVDVDVAIMTTAPVKDFWFNKTSKILTQRPAHFWGLLVAVSLLKVISTRRDQGVISSGKPPQNKTNLSAVSRPTPKCAEVKIEKTLAANNANQNQLKLSKD